MPTGNSAVGLFKVLFMAFDFINRLLPFIITLAVLYFVWGVFKYLMAAGDSDARKEARGFMVWGIVSLFVMVSVWGLVNVLVRSFRLDNSMPKTPQVPDLTISPSASTTERV